MFILQNVQEWNVLCIFILLCPSCAIVVYHMLIVVLIITSLSSVTAYVDCEMYLYPVDFLIVFLLSTTC